MIVVIVTEKIKETYGKITLPSIKAYADKIGHEYVEKVVDSYSWRDKALFDNYSKENLLCLDADIFIKKDAPNIFNEIDSIDEVGMVLDTPPSDPLGQTRAFEIIASQAIYGPLDWGKDYYNAGLILINSPRADIFHMLKDNDYYLPSPYPDQTLINYSLHYHYNLIFRKELYHARNSKLVVKSLDRKWNSHFFNFGLKENESAQIVAKTLFNSDSYFLHAAGFDQSGKEIFFTVIDYLQKNEPIRNTTTN